MDEELWVRHATEVSRYAGERMEALKQTRGDMELALVRAAKSIATSAMRLRESERIMDRWWYRRADECGEYGADFTIRPSKGH